jgi:hypothetical protein
MTLESPKPAKNPRREGKINALAGTSVWDAHQMAVFGTAPEWGVWDYLHGMKILSRRNLRPEFREHVEARVKVLRDFVQQTFIEALNRGDISTLERLARAAKDFACRESAFDPKREKILRMRMLLEGRGIRITVKNLKLFLDANSAKDDATLDVILRALKTRKLDRDIQGIKYPPSPRDAYAQLRREAKKLGVPIAGA